MMSLDDIAEVFAGLKDIHNIRVRQGVVIASHSGPPVTVDVQVAGSGVTVFGVNVMSHVTPVVSSNIWMMTDGADMVAFGVF